MGLAVVEAQGQELEVTCRALDLDFAEIGASVPDPANDVGTVLRFRAMHGEQAERFD